MKSFLKILSKFIIYFKNLKLMHKIALATSMIIIFSTLMTVLFSYIQFKSIVEQNSYKETHQMVVQLANYYNEKLTKIINLTHVIFENENFNNSLENILWDDQYNYAKESSTMQMIFQKMMLKDKFIDSFFLYTPKGMFYQDTQKLRYGMDFEKTQIFKRFDDTPTISWQASYANEIFESNSNVIPIVMNITTDRIFDTVYFVINLRETEFIKNLQDINATNKASVYIVNDNGELITFSEYSSYKDLLRSEEFKGRFFAESKGYFNYYNEGKRLYVNHAKIGINNWHVVIIQPEAELLKDVTRLQLYVLLIGMASVTIAVLLAIFVASTITKPIHVLKNTMIRIQNGNLGLRFKSKYTDEIGELGVSFNKMVDEIQSLILELEHEKERTKEEQKQKVKAEIRALQAQINPHFLYNTLDSIYWKSMLKENELVSDMIISLSSLLRIGLSKGKDKIPIASEIEHVRNYLYLQSKVYTNKFSYHIEVKGDISKYGTVKLILQPIVENSLLHGFDSINYTGLISIYIEQVDGKILFRVTDNGKGMDVEAVKSSLIDNKIEPKGYALKNVYQRIKLHYGEEFGLYIESKPYEETRIEIIIPAEEV